MDYLMNLSGARRETPPFLFSTYRENIIENIWVIDKQSVSLCC